MFDTDASISALHVMQDSNTLVSSSSDGTIRFWDLFSLDEVCTTQFIKHFSVYNYTSLLIITKWVYLKFHLTRDNIEI